MNCETARAAIIDALADSIDDDTRVTLDRHIAECEACTADAAVVRSLWRELGELEVARPAAGSTAAMRDTMIAAAVAAAGEDRGGGVVALPWDVRDRANGARRSTLLAASVALLIGLASGWFARDAFGMAGDTVTPTVASAPGNGLRPYLILLHGPPAPPRGSPPQDEAAVAAAVARYSAWADTLRMQGRLVSAEKLEDGTGRWLGEFPASGPPGSDLGGFFLILARSYDEAEAIAREGPHLGYGGTIELRAIENTGG